MELKTSSTRRTRIDDLPTIGTVLSDDKLESVSGGGLGLAIRSAAPPRRKTATYDFSDDPIIVVGGCTSSETEVSCDE